MGSAFLSQGQGGTGKSFLLNVIQYCCNTSHNPFLLLAPTGIAARNIDRNTIHSALSIYSEGGSYRTGFFQFSEEKQKIIKTKTILIIDEVSMVNARLLEYISKIFAKLHENNHPFGNLHMIAFWRSYAAPTSERPKGVQVIALEIVSPSLFITTTMSN